jgi:hypothetical protein
VDPGGLAAELARRGVPQRVIPATRPPAADLAIAMLDPEGLSEATLEAAGQGAALILLDAGGTLPDGFQPGRSCLLVPPDDPAVLLEAVERVVRDAEYRRGLGTAAHGVVSRIAPHFDDLIERYLLLFQQILAQPRELRSPGVLRPPPARVGDIGVFPVELPFDVPGVGRFPSRSDFEAFERHLGATVSRE